MFEFLELRNAGSVAAELEDYRFTEGIQFRFPPLLLEPSERVVIVNDQEAFALRYGDAVPVAGTFDGSLANSGEQLMLIGQFGETITTEVYDDDTFPTTDGDGASLVIENDVRRASAFEGGSPGIADPEPASLRITEVHYHPREPSSDEIDSGYTEKDAFEFVEITNIGPASVSLEGARLADGVAFTFDATHVLAAGQRLIVVRNRAAFENRNGIGAALIAGEFDGEAGLDNGVERLALLGPSGETIQRFRYDDDWLPVTDGDGASLVVRDAGQPLALWDQETGWRASNARDGSPGEADPAEPPRLRVTEIMFNAPEQSVAEEEAGFENNDEFDFIEIQNLGGDPIALTGFRITGGVEFTFGAGILAPGERIVVVEDEDAFQLRYGNAPRVAGSYSGGLDNRRDTLRLEDANGLPILEFEYEDWYELSDGNGRSLEIIDPSGHPVLWEHRSSWRISGDEQGNPDAMSSRFFAWQWEVFPEDLLDDPAIVV